MGSIFPILAIALDSSFQFDGLHGINRSSSIGCVGSVHLAVLDQSFQFDRL
jgi:hypothetical protein